MTLSLNAIDLWSPHRQYLFLFLSHLWSAHHVHHTHEKDRETLYSTPSLMLIGCFLISSVRAALIWPSSMLIFPPGADDDSSESAWISS